MEGDTQRIYLLEKESKKHKDALSLLALDLHNLRNHTVNILTFFLVLSFACLTAFGILLVLK